MVKCKICVNEKCKDSYKNNLTKWMLDLKVCPTCKSKLQKYETGSVTIKLAGKMMNILQMDRNEMIIKSKLLNKGDKNG